MGERTMKQYHNMNKILVLATPGYRKGQESQWGESVKVCSMYTDSRSILCRLKLRIALCFGHENWEISQELKSLDLNSYDMIIVSQVIYPELIIKYVRERNKHCKLYYWMWDSVAFSGKALLYNGVKHWKKLNKLRSRYNFEILSFDKSDCKKYNLIFHRQIIPVIKNLDVKIGDKYSIYFCGHDKGRVSLLKKLGHIFVSYGFKPHFDIVPGKDGYVDNKGCESFIHKCKSKSYLDFLTSELSHGAILEVVQSGQHGITWRPIEAAVYRRKLITNFKDIKNYDFYNPQNIFIIGEDNYNDLNIFLSSEFQEIPPEIINQYCFDGWLSLFMQKEMLF